MGIIKRGKKIKYIYRKITILEKQKGGKERE
jgi:hypothetical protein